MKILELRKKIGRLAAALRDKQKIDQIDFAQKIGMGKITLSKIERGKTDFRISTLDTLAQGFNMDVIEMISQAIDVPVSSSKNLAKLFELLKNEDEATIKNVLQQTEILLSMRKK